MTTQYDYCLEKATPEGSNNYYALLFEDKKIKSALIPLLALHREFIDCLTASPDPGITRLKFNWWHEELSRLSDNSPRHPVTREINSISINSTSLATILHEHLLVIESAIQQNQNQHYPDWLQHTINGFGKFWSILNSRSNCQVDSELLTTNGGLIFTLEIITLYPLFAGKSPGFLPVNLISKYRSDSFHTSYPGIFEELIRHIENNLGKIFTELKNVRPKPPLFNLAFNRLAIKTCEEILHDGCKIMQHRVQLIPIRKLLLCIQTRFTY